MQKADFLMTRLNCGFCFLLVVQTIRLFTVKCFVDQPVDGIQPKSRKKDGYLSDEEDPARRALRQEEQATRAARQIYFLRQQVRSLQEVVTRKGSGNVKHTKKVKDLRTRNWL